MGSSRRRRGGKAERFGTASKSASLRRRLREVAFVAILFVALSSRAAVQEVGAIGLTVADLDREIHFFTNILSFELIRVSDAAGREEHRLLGLTNVQIRTAELQLGAERITLTEHLTTKGKAIPSDSRSFDHWFQHIAIVVSDMDRAYARLRQHKVKPISTAPQTLPTWNKAAGGIQAFYFADPEDHVLEIIWFPAGKGDPKWQLASTRTDAASEPKVFLGIDHTAIVVSDTDRSLAFYRDVLGLRVAGESENYGVEQERLNQVFGARLRITALRAERGPGIEFLEYIAPSGGRALPKDASARDLIFWNTRLAVSDLPELKKRAPGAGVQAVTKEASREAEPIIVRDPDGHALQLNPHPVAAEVTRRNW